MINYWSSKHGVIPYNGDYKLYYNGDYIIMVIML